jgi:hypothetical protein
VDSVIQAVYKKWINKITSLIPLYKGLTFLTSENPEKGKIHPLFKVNCHTGTDISRLSGALAEAISLAFPIVVLSRSSFIKLPKVNITLF